MHPTSLPCFLVIYYFVAVCKVHPVISARSTLDVQHTMLLPRVLSGILLFPAARSQELYENYARQLDTEGQHHKCACIYLSIYHVYEAINVLFNSGLYK